MSITVAREGATAILVADSQLVVSNREELKQAVLGELDRGTRRFRIDLSKTGYVDSSGLGVLVLVSKRIRERGGELRIENANADLDALFHLTKLDTLFSLGATPGGGDAAAGSLAALRPKPAGPPRGASAKDRPPPDEASPR